MLRRARWGVPFVGLLSEDPLSLVMRVASLPTSEAMMAEIVRLQEAFEAYIVIDEFDLAGFIPTACPPPQLNTNSRMLMWKLADRAVVAADGQALGYMPSEKRLEFVRALGDVLKAVGVESLPWVTHGLYLLRPQSFLSLDVTMRSFVTSSYGLGIDDSSLPATAVDYLKLLMSLSSQMEYAELPYIDFLQMARAAQQGRTLEQGLTPEDRSVVVKRLRRTFARLYPCDEARVEAELARLIE